jgi:crotonobetainyl-CoA:carnitine CoA-transferase CaiB-like acyl-CoA transferase
MPNATGALTGLRIIDMTHALAGPFCTQVLADHGADVMKIEPLEGDFFRNIGPWRDDDKARHFGGLFQACNRNKRSLAVNLKDPQGAALVRELVRGADALVENYRAGAMEKLGLGYDSLRAENPRLVYTSIRGFGDVAGGRSPYMSWPSFDIVAQAMGGWMGVTGADADHPVKVGGGPGDTVTGLFAAFGTMAALWQARATGEGQYVDTAMVDCVLALSESVVSHYAYRGVSLEPMGNAMPGIAPFDTYRCSDGIIAIAAPHDPQWTELCRLMDRAELLGDPRFASENLRWENRNAVRDAIEAFTEVRTKEELRGIFGGRVPFSPIYCAADIFADPHFAVRDMLPELEHPGSARPAAVPGVPVKLSRTPGSVRHRAPLVGEHTRDILAQIGIEPERIERLAQSGAVAVR